MGLMDILQQYAGEAAAPAPAGTHDDYAAVATQAPREALGGGIAEALRNDAGGGLAASVEKLFESSNPDQKAGLLSRLIQAAGPAILASVAGGALSRFGAGTAGSAPAVSPPDTAAITGAQAGELAEAVRQRDPTIVDRVGSFYSEHPLVVKALGAAALAVAMNHIAKRV